MTRIDTDTAADYLARRGVVPAGADPDVRSLGGGVSNRVVRVAWDGGCLVLKQPLPNLDVADDWPADVARVHNEAAAMDAYAEVVAEAGLDAVAVPAVAFEDGDAHVVGLECAPEDARMWKRDLLDGTVDRSVAATVGDLLGAVHDAAAGDDDLRTAFANQRPFVQLRVDPYHRTVAERHPDVADRVEAEADRVRDASRTLVHGDYSPKNVLVRDEGPVWVLDFEVAHWGDPAFDAAFMLNHLCIKAIHVPSGPVPFLDAARTFWRAYESRVPWDVGPATATELGVLMLARVDGKSPVEYVTDPRVEETLRDVAKRVLTGDVAGVEDALARVREGRERLEAAR